MKLSTFMLAMTLALSEQTRAEFGRYPTANDKGYKVHKAKPAVKEHKHRNKKGRP